jgi:glycerol-3-phosphate dehydrogenase subunit B
MSDADLLVVGSGLGGCMAALAAAREAPETTVRLVASDGERFAHHSGTIDVLGSLPSAPETPVGAPLDAIEELPPEHPYRRLGSDTLRAALAAFDETVPGYRGGHTEANALVVTHGGEVKPAARYPAGMAPGLASRNAPMALVGFEQVPDLDAELAADRLTERLPYPVAHHTVEFPGDVRQYPSSVRLARALDDNEPPSDEHLAGTPEVETPEETDEDLAAVLAAAGDEDDDRPVRQTLAERIAEVIDVQPRIGVPAVLGLSEATTVRRALRERLHAEVFEIPTGPPSVLGRRLEARLQDALADAGVTVETGEVTDVEADGGRIKRVTVDGQAQSVSSVVLATGGVAAGGLVPERSGVRERMFDCHVDCPDDRTEWTEERFLGDHAFARFGVAVDDELRPLDAAGETEYENLRAVGRLLGGVDYDTEQSGDGVAIVTGYAAGRWTV